MIDQVTAIYLAIGAGLFVLGAIGFLTRRHMILMILSAELMLHGVALTFVTFSKMHGTNEGQAFTIFLLTVAACDAGLALSLFLALYQSGKSLDVDVWTDLREPDLAPPSRDIGSPVAIEPPDEFPHLSPAGRPPTIYEDSIDWTNPAGEVTPNSIETQANDPTARHRVM